MAIKQDSFSSIGELLDKLAGVHGNDGFPIWFRGHEVTEWQLRPSIMRRAYRVEQEMGLIKAFQQHGTPLLDKVPDHEWEWLFLMQHHGVPTRLLDWSESPLVGLFFALLEPQADSDKGKDSALWCLYPLKLNEMAGVRLESDRDIPAFGVDIDLLGAYLPARVSGVSTATNKPISIVAPRQFRRLHVQQGSFTLFHRNTTAIDELVDVGGQSPHLVKLVIPYAAKERLRKELRYLQIDDLAIFPELERVARRILSQLP